MALDLNTKEIGIVLKALLKQGETHLASLEKWVSAPNRLHDAGETLITDAQAAIKDVEALYHKILGQAAQDVKSVEQVLPVAVPADSKPVESAPAAPAPVMVPVSLPLQDFPATNEPPTLMDGGPVPVLTGAEAEAALAVEPQPLPPPSPAPAPDAPPAVEVPAAETPAPAPASDEPVDQAAPAPAPETVPLPVVDAPAPADVAEAPTVALPVVAAPAPESAFPDQASALVVSDTPAPPAEAA